MAPRPPKLFLPARHTSAVTRRSQRAMCRAGCLQAHGVWITRAHCNGAQEAVLIGSGGDGCSQSKRMAWKGLFSLMPRRRQSASCAGQLLMIAEAGNMGSRACT